MRYKEENLFLFATIPGPHEPKLEQINHLLKPLVSQFQELWNGIFFTSTKRHSKGRVIRAVIWPIIADLPAMQKVAGLAGHSAKLFCAHCALLKRNITQLDIETWPQRTNHQQNADEWQNATTLGDQNSIFNEYGLRWTVLSELPYWQPIDFITVDVMHCIILGMLSDHGSSCLGLVEAGNKLKSINASAALKARRSPDPSDDQASSINPMSTDILPMSTNIADPEPPASTSRFSISTTPRQSSVDGGYEASISVASDSIITESIHGSTK